MRKVTLSKKLRELSLTFPETTEEIEYFERNIVFETVPINWRSPEEILKSKSMEMKTNFPIFFEEKELAAYKMAARDGKILDQEILDKLEADREKLNSRKDE